MTHRQILWAKAKLVEYQKFAAMESGEQVDFLLCDTDDDGGGATSAILRKKKFSD